MVGDLDDVSLSYEKSDCGAPDSARLPRLLFKTLELLGLFVRPEVRWFRIYDGLPGLFICCHIEEMNCRLDVLVIRAKVEAAMIPLRVLRGDEAGLERAVMLMKKRADVGVPDAYWLWKCLAEYLKNFDRAHGEELAIVISVLEPFHALSPMPVQ